MSFLVLTALLGVMCLLFLLISSQSTVGPCSVDMFFRVFFRVL